MLEVNQNAHYDVPLETAFAFVDDPAHVSSWMFGVNSFAPASGSVARGLGAVYDVVFSVKPVKIKTTLRVVDYVENELIRFESIKGFTNESTWRFSAASDAATAISVRFGYELPGGLAGKALGRALEPIISLTIRDSEHNLRKRLAEVHAGS